MFVGGPRGSLRCVLLAGALSAACAGSGQSPQSPDSTRGAPVVFDFVAVDGTHVSSATTIGRVTAVAFITTYDLPSQVLVQNLAELVRHRTPRMNALAVVLEPPKNAPLAETFAATLSPGFPVALSDSATLEQRGPFGPVGAVPTLVVLDRTGTEVFRREGAMSAAELEAAVDGK